VPGLERPEHAPDGASDHGRPAGPGDGTVRDPVRASVLTRQERVEQAAAYRAVVAAAYGPEGGRGSPEQPGVPDIAARYAADYVRAQHEPPRVDRPHESPERWIRAVNADQGLPGRDNNCGECARAVNATWHGRPAAAAALADRDASGESTGRMAEWAGRQPEPVTMAGVARRLAELGPGSSAVVGCDWSPDGTGGHWFNAVNDAGTVKAVDGQPGQAAPWPPSVSSLGFEERYMARADAIFFTPDGKAVPHDQS
jgi:hypothetical protein